MIRMKSQDGGFMHAYTESDEKYLMALGWVRESAKAEPAKVEIIEAIEVKRGPGRPKSK